MVDPYKPVYIYVGAGIDTTPFLHDWANGSVIHCIDGQPHSEFGIREYYGNTDGSLLNGFSRPNFARNVVDEYRAMGYECSPEDISHVETTGLLGPTLTRLGGVPTRIQFINVVRDITILYHFNTGLPEDTLNTLQIIGPYNGIVCRGHWPHRSIIDCADIPDNSLIFRGYAGTVFGIDDYVTENEIESSMVVRLSFDHQIRRKFKLFVFYDTYGEENWFDTWEEYLVFIHYNQHLTYEDDSNI